MYKLFHFHAVDPRGFIPSERNDKALLPFHDLGTNVHGSLLRHANVNDRAGLPRNVVLVRVGGVCRLMRQLRRSTLAFLLQGGGMRLTVPSSTRRLSSTL